MKDGAVLDDHAYRVTIKQVLTLTVMPKIGMTLERALRERRDGLLIVTGQRIELTGTPSNLRPEYPRPWMRCPQCRRRVQVLWWPYGDKTAACRLCKKIVYGTTYRKSRKSAPERLRDLVEQQTALRRQSNERLRHEQQNDEQSRRLIRSD